MSQRRIYINGRFLTQPISGVQRYAREIVKALDVLLADRADPDIARFHWTLLAPSRATCDLGLRAIRFERHGSAVSHRWDQTTLARAARGAVVLSLCGSGPLFHARHLVVMHDAAIYRYPECYTRSYRLFHSVADHVLTRFARLATVSEFSRAEISAVLPVDPRNIVVAPNAWQHISRLRPDDSVVARLGLAGTPFFLTVGSLTPNKNIQTAAAAIERLPEGAARLVIVGGADRRVFRAAGDGFGRGVVFAGTLSDDAVAGLMRYAAALVFPSRYEGFGIPPLEAMAQDCPVLASNAEAVVEVCGDAAEYFGPSDVERLAFLMRKILQEDGSARTARILAGRARLTRYSWSASARVLASVCVAMASASDT